MPVPVTLLYGGLNVLLVTVLGANVTRVRGQVKAFVGDAVPPALVRPQRAHGNAAEYVPLGVLGLLLLELAGLGSLWLHLLGGGFLLARVLHATGVLLKNPASTVGAGLNYLVLLSMGGAAVWLHFLR